jgi:hypothetical protein
MKNSKEILTELREIAPVLSRDGVSRIPYGIPSGYFEDFSAKLMRRIHWETAGISDSENAGISSGTEPADISPQEEISTISPLLAGLQKKNPYQVPAGYFEALKTKIPSSEESSIVNAAESISSKRVALPSGLSASGSIHFKQGSISSQEKPVFSLSRVLKYAVAACLIGLLGITIYNMNNRNVTDPISGLTTVSDQDMANFLDAADFHWTPGSTSETATVDFSDNDIHELFSNISDAELEQYHIASPAEKRSVN